MIPCTVAPKTRERQANIGITRGKRARNCATRAQEHNLANETLSPGLSALAETLRAGYHRAANMGRLMGDLSGAVKTSDHPVVRTYPETGRKALCLSYDPTVRLEGFSEVESRAIVALFAAHATQPMFCYRHRWQPGDVLMWDNRCALHFAVHDYGEQERTHYRTTVAGDVPR
jgi:taurine dioxygenase